jgi:hypothetical protein
MIFHIVETRNCWLFLPHGEEPVAWYCSPEGGDVLRAAGWRPFEMHCVSGFVRGQLLASGDLRVLYNLNEEVITGDVTTDVTTEEPPPSPVRSFGVEVCRASSQKS